jgi:hypothetical protein
MRYGYDIPRRDVTLDGIPLKWHTNLTDDQIARLYWRLKVDPDITQPSASVNVSGFFSISLHIFDKFVEFEDGACHCIGVNDTIYAIYKTAHDWDLWAARRAEIQELEEEQALEREVERELLKTEEYHLIERCTERITARDYESAYLFLCARANLLRDNTKHGLAYFFIEEIFMRLSSFPVDYCTKFLEQYSLPWTAYPRLMGSMAFWRKASDSELNVLCEAGISRFPHEGMLFKDIVLFWRRRNNIDFAVYYCEVAVRNEVKDDTKSGFSGRLKRLKKEAEQGGAPNTHPRHASCLVADAPGTSRATGERG